MSVQHAHKRERTKPSQFAVRTKLHDGEYHRQFRKLDRMALERVRSPEALAVTLAMGTIYIALADAPEKFTESDRVLYFTGEQTKDGERLTAIQQLAAYVCVSVGTLLKALRWMDAEGIIGYDPYKNGAGIRIFINLATSSIGKRNQCDQKNLPMNATPNAVTHTANFDAPFMDSFAVPESFRLKDSALENSASTKLNSSGMVSQSQLDLQALIPTSDSFHPDNREASTRPITFASSTLSLGVIPTTSSGMNFSIVEVAMQAARQAASETVRATAEQTARATTREIARQQEQTRHWLETSVMPKVARVAQHEAYKVHKHHGTSQASAARTRADLRVGREIQTNVMPSNKHRVDFDEAVRMCLTALELNGSAGVEQTLEIMCNNGEMTCEDATRARAVLAMQLENRGQTIYEYQQPTPVTSLS